MQEFAHTVNVTQDGAVTTLQFESDHPANVFTLPLLEELTLQIEKLSTDGSCRALIIKGRDKIFSGGADLTSIQAMDPHTYRTYVEVEYHLFRQVELLPFIMACDLRVASDRAKIGWPELNVAFDAPAQRLARFVGIGRAKEIIFSARLLRADEAHALGLLTTVVTPDELADATREAATLYASRPPIGVRLTKENIERAYPFPMGNASLEIDAAAQAFATADFQEGADAVLNRRDPVFTGR